MATGGEAGNDRQAGLSAAPGRAWGAWLAAALLAWMGGIALQLQQPALWPVGHYLVCMGAAVAVGLAGWRRQRLLMVLACAALGFGFAGWRAHERLAERLPAALEGQDLWVTGVVATLPHTGESGTRFQFQVEQASWRGQAVAVPRTLALGWYRQAHDDALLADPRAGLRAGQRWRLPVRLKRPHGSLNPGGFDYELLLFEQGVRATGYVRSTAAQPAERLADAAGFPVERLRQAVRDAIFERVAEPRLAGVLAALAIGDQGAIEREDWELFRAAGIAHLVSISGLHVTMFAWLAGGLIGWAWRGSARLVLRWPAPWAARWGGVAAAAAYALLAGWGVPAQRTVWMLLAAAALATLGLAWPWLLVLLAAAAVVTLLDPWALLQPGFWLSFVAVGLLMSSSPAQAPRGAPAAPGRWRAAGHALWRAVREGLRTQAVATLGLAPLTLVFFQQLSLVGFVANLVAIPLVTLLVTPLALLGMLAAPLWSVGAGLVQALVRLLALLTGLPGAVWSVAPAPWWAQAAGLAAGALLLLPLPWRLRLLALPMALPLLWPAVPVPAPGRFELLVADVGQGTAVLVRTQRHLLLYDTGPQYSRDSDAGQRVLLPLLRRHGTPPIDLLVLSHGDMDHVGGAPTLLRHWPVRAISSSLPADHPLRALGHAHTACRAGQQWQWDGVRFAMLHPLAEPPQALPPGMKPPKPNTLSCVLRVQDAQGRSVLLTGDAESAQEAAMLQADASALRSDLLLVPHHGSRTSSTAAFLDAVAPRVAIVQAGYRSRFGHPAPEVMQRYAQRGIPVVRTDRCGAWHWSAEASHCERDIARRYWHFSD